MLRTISCRSARVATPILQQLKPSIGERKTGAELAPALSLLEIQSLDKVTQAF